MDKFIINDEIIKSYLNRENIFQHANDEVFILGPVEDGLSIFEKPSENDLIFVIELYKQLKESLNQFAFKNNEKINDYLGDLRDFLKDLTIKLVVGMPPTITKLFRSINNKIIIVFDLHNWSQKDKVIAEIIEEIIDYIRYIICLMTLDSRLEPETDNEIGLLYHSIFIASFAFFLSDSNQLKRSERSSEYSTMYYLEEATLRRIARQNQNGLANKFINNIVQINPEMEYLGVTGKAFLSSLNAKGKTDQIKSLFNQGSYHFINVLINEKMTKKSRLFRLHLIFTITMPILAIIIATWSFISISKKTFGIELKLLPIIYALLMVVYQVLKLITHQTRLKQFFIYLGLIIFLVSVYSLFIFIYLA